jgi:hypothetical protein
MRSSLFVQHRHRSSAEIIGRRGWLYFCLALGFRDVEEVLVAQETLSRFSGNRSGLSELVTFRTTFLADHGD